MTITDLRAVRDMHMQIQGLNERIARLRSALESCSPGPLKRTPGGKTGPRDRLGEDVARLIELEERRLAQIIDLELRLEGVERWIETLPPSQATVVRMFYVDGRSWRQISRRLHYHPDTCRKIRDAAIKDTRLYPVQM